MWVPLSILIKKNEKQTKQKAIDQSSWTEGQTEVSEILIFFSFKSSFFDSRVSDCRISSGQTRKVLYATRATRGN